MYSVLADQTRGAAWLRVKSVDMGEGISAHVKLHKWFMGTSGWGVSETCRQILAPAAPKGEGGIAGVVENGLEG